MFLGNEVFDKSEKEECQAVPSLSNLGRLSKRAATGRVSLLSLIPILSTALPHLDKITLEYVRKQSCLLP